MRGIELAVDELVAHAGPRASLLGTILMPYFLSNSITDAITTDAQSVSGMKPTLTSVFSGASEPAAHAPARNAGSTSAISAPATPAESTRRRWATALS
jgi:hypothetical protein